MEDIKATPPEHKPPIPAEAAGNANNSMAELAAGIEDLSKKLDALISLVANERIA